MIKRWKQAFVLTVISSILFSNGTTYATDTEGTSDENKNVRNYTSDKYEILNDSYYLTADYDMSRTEDKSNLKNLVEGGKNAPLVNLGDENFIKEGNDNVLKFNKSAKNADNYVKIPNVISGENFAVEIQYVVDLVQDQFLWTLGTNDKNYLFFNPKKPLGNGNIYTGIRYNNVGDSTNSDTAISSAVTYPTNQYSTALVVFNHGSVSMYKDGVKIGTTKTTGFSIQKLLDASSTEDTIGYIGKSVFSDPYFKGKITSFKIYQSDSERDTMLKSDYFKVDIDENTGGIFNLSNPNDVYDTNYVMNPVIRSDFNINDSRWVGDMVFNVKKTTGSSIAMTTSLSDDSRKVSSTADGDVQVSYSGKSSHSNGIKGFELSEKYSLDGTNNNQFNWTINIKNTSAESLEFQDIGFPLLMNAWWNGGDQTGIYEENVARHSFVAEDGSYIYWQRPNGVGPYLVMIPQDGTSLEFKDKARTGEGPFGEKDPSWEGLVEYYIHSKNIAPSRTSQNKSTTYLPATSLTLPAGEEKTYGFTFRWAEDYADLRDVLYEAGVVDAVSLPGMVVPNDQNATLAVRAKDGIKEVIGEESKNVKITKKGEKNGYQIYELNFAKLGVNNVTVNYGNEKKSVLQYYSTKPIEELIEANTEFIVDNQQAKDTNRGYDGAFLQWDMDQKKVVTRQDYSKNITSWLVNWLTGGSDDLGLSPATFISEKNVVEPNQVQIDAIDYYLENFIWGYMQTQKDESGNRTYRLYHWYDGTDGSSPSTGDGKATWRVMNYPHVWNTYYNMYRITTMYPHVKTELSAEEYLLRAYNTMKAYFQHPNVGTLDDASREMGSMGEMTMPDIVEALNAEGYTSEADELDSYILTKGEEMLAREYPFSSEMSIDTTAFEAVYTLAKELGNDAMAKKVTLASMASRGMQPLWYFYGSDNRHMGESWWNLSYETQLGAWQQQDYLYNYVSVEDSQFDEIMRSTYGAYVAGWANINAGQISTDPANYGAASWIYNSQKGAGEGQWQFMPMLDGWWAYSGESALGFWGGLKTASVNVVNDDIVGLYAYGGEVILEEGAYKITPKDGVRTRLTLYNENKFAFELSKAKYTEAIVSNDLTNIHISLEDVTDVEYSPEITLRNLPAGEYDVFVGNEMIQEITSDGSETIVKINNISGDAVVEITASSNLELERLDEVLNYGSSQGLIDSDILESLKTKVTSVQKAPNESARQGKLNSLMNQIKAQSDKKIDKSFASKLLLGIEFIQADK